MSRLEAFMVALGMILLGMAAARADEPPKLPEIIRGSGPTVEQTRAAPLPARSPIQTDVCDPVVLLPAMKDRRGGGSVAARPVRHEARMHGFESAIVPAFNGPIVPSFR
jgi:hypothetical protein